MLVFLKDKDKANGQFVQILVKYQKFFEHAWNVCFRILRWNGFEIIEAAYISRTVKKWRKMLQNIKF